MSLDKTDKLISLNKLELSVGILMGVCSIVSLCGSFIILPYRVAENEKETAKNEARIQSIEEEDVKTHELLIRMDERLRTIQDRLDIKHEPETK